MNLVINTKEILRMDHFMGRVCSPGVMARDMWENSKEEEDKDKAYAIIETGANMRVNGKAEGKMVLERSDARKINIFKDL